jgi:hypothetical protein
MTDIPIAIDEPVKDVEIIRERLMDELCKRQRDTKRNGKPEPWNITDVWQSAFQSRGYIDRFIERSRFDFKFQNCRCIYYWFVLVVIGHKSRIILGQVQTI